MHNNCDLVSSVYIMHKVCVCLSYLSYCCTETYHTITSKKLMRMHSKDAILNTCKLPMWSSFSSASLTYIVFGGVVLSVEMLCCMMRCCIVLCNEMLCYVIAYHLLTTPRVLRVLCDQILG